MKNLTVCWLSAGVSSFVAGYLMRDTVDKYIYIDIADQHEDSTRFIKDCEKVLGKEVEIMVSNEYRSVEDCVRVFGGFRNARSNFYPCTNWLKMRIRKQWEQEHKEYELTYIWGFDANEKARAERLIEANPQASHIFPLIDKGLSKEDVHAICERLEVKRPAMYDLGFPNNNCIGCLKGGMGYWNNIRIHFPKVFESRAKLEREIGYSILKQCYLDELEPTRGNMNQEIFPDCSIMCYLAER